MTTTNQWVLTTPKLWNKTHWLVVLRPPLAILCPPGWGKPSAMHVIITSKLFFFVQQLNITKSYKIHVWGLLPKVTSCQDLPIPTSFYILNPNKSPVFNGMFYQPSTNGQTAPGDPGLNRQDPCSSREWPNRRHRHISSPNNLSDWAFGHRKMEPKFLGATSYHFWRSIWRKKKRSLYMVSKCFKITWEEEFQRIAWIKSIYGLSQVYSWWIMMNL